MTERATLSPQQRAIVDADLAGPRLVDAGAGTGKTHTLVARACDLVERGVLAPGELLVVTFTNAAASEIAERLERGLPAGESRRPTCGTFHGIAGALIREFAYATGESPDLRVIDDGRARGVFARAYAELVRGDLDVDLSAYPLLERREVLERNLATMVLGLKAQGLDVGDVLARARERASDLETLAFGDLRALDKRSGLPRKHWPKPAPPRSPAERCDEAARERRNVDVVAAVFGCFQARLDREGLLTFGDVIGRATSMLHAHPAIARTLRVRFRHAIVDEFQDTNRTQIALLEAIFGPDLAPVFAVGDVRQAIYEFNGADPGGILAFRERAVQTLPLTTNRRSFQPILDVAHFALETLAGVAPELNTPLEAHRGAVDPACVRIALFSGADALQREAAAVAGTIADLVASGVSPKACAVLLRTRGKASTYAAALRERGLAVQLHGGVGFFESPEIREVTAWLRLANDPTDAFATVATLQSAAIALGDGAVALLARDRDVARGALHDPSPPEFGDDERERLERYRAIARLACDLGDADVVEAVRAIVTASGAEIARLRDESLPQVRANLDKLVRFAADFAADRPLARIADLVAELDERDAFELDLPLAELAGDRVSLMTIHGAKGLEWEHVFLANVSPSTFPLSGGGPKEKVVEIDPLTGALAMKFAVDGRPPLRWLMTRHPHDDAGIVTPSEAGPTLEEFRLLYVALTRARDALYVSGRTTGKSSVSACMTAVRNWPTAIGRELDVHAFATDGVCGDAGITADTRSEIDDTAQQTLFARIDRLLDPVPALERRGRLSATAIDLYEHCPRRARYRYVLGLPAFDDDAPWLDREAEGGRTEPRDPARYGRVVHAALEAVARARMDGASWHVEHVLADAFAAEEWAPGSATVAAAHAAVVEAARALDAYVPLAAEREWTATIDGVELGGFIDLIARDATGRIAIVDYKTGRTEGEHYALQFALYAYAMRDQYPGAATRILRIAPTAVAFEEVVLLSDARLREAIANAHAMSSDEPRPGAQCAACPYAGDACDAAPASLASRTLTSACVARIFEA